jgi:hypothetical protein
MDWNELPQEYRDLEETFNKEEVLFNEDENYIDEKFCWEYTPQGHEFWKECLIAETIEELPKIPKFKQTIQ